MDDSDEEWKRIPTYPKYEVSNLGRVRNTMTANTLNGTVDDKGYHRVWVRGRWVTTHSLVACAFLGPRPPAHDINHIDGDKRNNLPANLEYLTRADHIAHGLRLGLNTIMGNAKLRPEDVPVIRVLKKTHSFSSIAKRYGVTAQCIKLLIWGETWTHIP